MADVADTVLLVVQPGGGDALQFLKAGVMEIPDLLVVTKADLGQIAAQTARELSSALRALGRPSACVFAVSAVAPQQGIEQLLAALAELGVPERVAERRPRARRASAVSDYAHEHGARGLRALGGRRAAERLLEARDSGLDSAALLAALEEAAGL